MIVNNKDAFEVSTKKGTGPILDTKNEILGYVADLCSRIKSKGLRSKTRKKLLFNLRNKYGAIV